MGDAGLDDGGLLLDALALGGLLGRDLGVVDGTPPRDLARLDLLLVGYPGLADGALLDDPGRLDLFARSDFGSIDRLLALDLLLANLAFGRDAGLADGALVGDAQLLDLFARRNLGAFGFGVALGPFAGQFGLLAGAANLQFTLLLQAGVFAVAIDLQAELLGLQILVADLDQGVLLDVVAHFLAALDLVGQPGQTLGVEGVGRVEELHVGLIHAGQRHRFQLQAAAQQLLGHRVAQPAGRTRRVCSVSAISVGSRSIELEAP
jgi:hypothetical protein